MEMTVQQAIDSSRRLESQLTAELEAENVSFVHVAGTLDQIRAACTTALLQDYETASKQRAEDRLWAVHQEVNKHFRTRLAKAKKSKANNAVERRRLGHDYLKFLKQSQKFYRSFVRDLATAYGGIPELEQVAGRLNREFSSSPNNRKEVTYVFRLQCLQSCHRTLIQLGDLSRYRETELGGDEKNWAPAVGFYDLANTILPTSGVSHNQLAVIALAEDNLFRATYHIYRGLVAEDPHPQADENLRRAFNKASRAFKNRELFRQGSSPEETRTRLLFGWYLELISQYYHGKEFREREEMETEVISRFEAEVSSNSRDNTGYRMTLINIAAGYASEERFRTHASEEQLRQSDEPKDDKPMNSYSCFFRFNVRTLLTMVLAFERDLRDHFPALETEAIDLTEHTRRLSESLKKMLPDLRLYSAWLLNNTPVIVHGNMFESKPDLPHQLWRAYARLLTRLAHVFPSSILPKNDLVLDEDVDILGFKPLRTGNAVDVWFTGDKCPATDEKGRILLQVKSILRAGLKLIQEDAPLALDLDTTAFFYEPDGSPEIIPAGFPVAVNGSVDAPENGPLVSQGLGITVSSSMESHSAATRDADAQDIEAERMVNNLVDVGDENFPDPSGSIDTLPEKDDPKTPPPQLASTDAVAASNSSYPIGTHTADVLVEAVKTYSVRQRSASPRNFSLRETHAMPLSSNASQVASPALMHPPPRPSSYGRDRHSGGSGGNSTSPNSVNVMAHQQASPVVVPGTLETSPALDHGSHSRVQSTDSSFSVWSPESWRTPRPPSMSFQSPASGHLGNGTFGVINQTPTSERRQNGSTDVGIASSVVWGAPNTPWQFSGAATRAAHSPWNAQGSSSRSMHTEIITDTPALAASPRQNVNARPFT